MRKQLVLSEGTIESRDRNIEELRCKLAEAEKDAAIFQNALKNFPTGCDEYGIYADWKASIDAEMAK